MATIDVSLLKPELIFFDFEASDRLDFFTRLSQVLQEERYVKETWLEAILEREKSFPTGLACEAVSVALPHVDPEHITKPYIAIIKPHTPISFDGMADTGLVEAELIVNLGLQAHAEDQVAALQAFLNIFIDDAASAQILSQTTPESMIKTIIHYTQQSS